MADAPRDYYALLGVRKDATPEEIKRAYRKLARELHPDVNPDPAAQERFKEVTTAYEVLSDPEKRRIVDLGGDPLAAAAAGPAGSPFAGFGGFGDIFEAFFGGGGRRRRPRPRAAGSGPAPTRCCGCRSPWTEAAFGVRREITVDTAVVCETCSRRRLRARHLAAHLRDLRRARARSSRCSARSSAR